MRIFFSYADDGNRPLVERLRDDLSEKHNIWTYTRKIKAGEDWRRSIVDGLLNSGLVVGFLSRKSTGDGGVCLDELAIALHVKNGAITTILLEPEDQVRPPVSLSHIQWLDMHDWAEHRWRGKGAWKKWYAEKLATLSTLLDNPQTRHFPGEIDELQRRLRPVSQSAEIGVLLDGFVGREWLAQEVENWRRTAKSSRLFWLAGAAGMGKSAFSAWLAHHGKANVVGINLCRYNMDERRDASFVLRTIAFQIASRLPDYRRLILERLRGHDPDGSGLGHKGAPALFDWLLAEPLRLSIDGGRSEDRFLVVIDGLDETVVDGRSEIAEVLGASARKLPDWMAMVVTSCCEDEIKRQFADLQPLVIDAEVSEKRGGYPDLCARVAEGGFSGVSIAGRVDRRGFAMQFSLCAQVPGRRRDPAPQPVFAEGFATWLDTTVRAMVSPSVSERKDLQGVRAASRGFGSCGASGPDRLAAADVRLVQTQMRRNAGRPRHPVRATPPKA